MEDVKEKENVHNITSVYENSNSDDDCRDKKTYCARRDFCL